MTKPFIVCLAAAMALGTARAHAQQPVFRAGVELLQVDVNVVDDRGRPLADLHAPDFAVSIDGKPRRIVSAEFVTVKEAKSAAEVAEERGDPGVTTNASTRNGRLVVIGVDRQGTSFGNGASSLKAAERFLGKLTRDDKVALVTVPGGGPSVDFTSNHELVRKQLQRSGGVAQRPQSIYLMGIYEAFSIDEHSDYQTENAVMTRICGSQLGAAGIDCQTEVRVDAGQIANEMRKRTSDAMNALRAVLESLRDIDGPKSLIWVSESLLVTGPGGDLADIPELAAAANTTVHVLMLDAPLADASESQRSPTADRDREMAMAGLDLLAGGTRGTMARISVGADYAFERIVNELSAFYLLGVETLPSDNDGKRHAVKVNVQRKGVTVRSRKEFRVTPEMARTQTPEERAMRALRSPFALTELPVRVATYAYKDPGTAKVRVLIASDAQAGADAAGATSAFALLDRDGRVIASHVNKAGASTAGNDGRGAVILLDPGTYTLRYAVVNGEGRRGSVEHTVDAWQMTGVPFAVSDLMLADSPEQLAGAMLPSASARVKGGQLATYLEVYADKTEAFGSMTVRLEAARDDNAAPLASGSAALQPHKDALTRTVSAMLPVDALPPGTYVARATISRDGKIVGKLSRPFEVTGQTPAAAAQSLSVMLSKPTFKKETAFAPQTLAVYLDALDARSPSLKAVTAGPRAGKFEGAGMAAFETGDQTAAAFLRGLELLNKGDLNGAATQFNNALRQEPAFTQAAYYLGACFALGGKDAEAMATWRRAVAGAVKTPAAYTALADAQLRIGAPEEAIAPLAEALQATPNDDGVRKRLAAAQALAGHGKDALATVEPYLTRHKDDQEALLVALNALYATHAAGATIGPDDGTRMASYARAYAATKGPQAAMVEAWARFVAGRK